jgi:hypothetical protein
MPGDIPLRDRRVWALPRAPPAGLTNKRNETFDVMTNFIKNKTAAPA